MAAGAEIRFLRNRGARADLNFAEAVSVCAIAQTGAIVQRQVPGHGDARALMHERRAVDFRIEDAQPKKSPRIEWLRGPLTENEPAEFPERPQSALAIAPRGFERAGLIRINDLFVRHLK